jgi:hypothetical protein
MAMLLTKRVAVVLPCFLLAIAPGCDSPVDLEVDFRDPSPPGPSGTLQPDLDWFATDSESSSNTTHVDWAADGSVTVASRFAAVSELGGVGGVSRHMVASLTRFAADGTSLWTEEIEGPLPRGGGDAPIDSRTTIGALDTFDDGRTVVAVNGATTVLGDSNLVRKQASVLRWYGADGSLLETRSLDASGDREAVILVRSVVALPDGGVAFTGATTSGYDPDASGMIVTGSAIVRLRADGTAAWTVPIRDDVAWPDLFGLGPVDDAVDLQMTRDGGLVVGGSFSGDIAIGDRHAWVGNAAFFARVELDDGRCSWLRTVEEVDGPAHPGVMAVAESGHVIATGFFDGILRMDHLSLEAPTEDSADFVAEIDATDGSVLRLSLLEPLPAVVGHRGDSSVSALALDGDQVVTVGGAYEASEDGAIALQGPYVARHDLGGQLLDARHMSVIPPDPLSDFGSSLAVSVSPDGRVAVGGEYEGQADFGDGPVSSEPALEHISNGFIAVYELPAVAVD